MPEIGIAINARKATLGAEEAKRAIAKVRRETGQLDRAQKKLARTMTTTGAAAKASGNMLGTAFAGIGVLAGITKMVRTISSLDEAMARLQGVTGRTDEQMQILEQTARKLGATTSFTAGQAADGMLMLARAGMDANQVIAATGPVLDLAKVAGVSLEQSSTLLADSLKQFGMQAHQTGMAADQLTLASNSTNTSIEQLAEGLKLAGPVAHAAGLSLSDTSAILGVLADAGLKATLGGTGLRSVLAALAQPSSSAAEALHRLGIDTSTLSQKIQTKGGLLEVMSKLGPETMDMTDAITIFSRRGAAAALTLASNTKRWRALTGEIEKANGVARDSAKLIEDTLGDSFKTLMSAIEEAILVIGESGFTQAIKSLVEFVTEGVRALTSLETGLTRSGAAAAVFVAALGGGAALAAMRRMLVTLWAIVRGPMAAIKAHPIMAAITAVTFLVEGFIALASETSFTTEKMKEFNEAVKGINQSTKSLVGQFRMLQEFGGERMFKGQVRIFQQMQTETRNLMTLLLDFQKGQEFPAERFDTFARSLKEIGVRPKGMLMQGRFGPEKQVGRDQAIEELKRIHRVLDIRLGTANSSLDAIKKAREEAAAAAPVRITPVSQDPAHIAAKALKDEIADMQRGLGELGAEHRMLKLERDKGIRAAEVERRLIEIVNNLREKHSIPVHYEQEQAIRKLIEANMDLTDEIDKQAVAVENQKAFAQNMADGIVAPLRNAILDGDFSMVGQQMYMNVVAGMLDEMAMKPLAEGVQRFIMELIKGTSIGAGAAAANGMALSGGVQRFATGGIVSKPQFFGMAGGRTGLMGEAGPEAIMPLKRMPGGRLGVEAQGNGTTVNDNRTINIQVQDDAGFRRTMRQLDRDTARRLQEGTR